MSWNTNAGIPAGGDIAALVEILKPVGNDDAAQERDEQCEAVREAVSTFLMEGGLGDLEKCGVVVRVTGHANPGHGRREGWANEFVSIEIGQAYEASKRA